MLQRHPPRIPIDDERYTPSGRTDDPRGVIAAPCIETPSPITRYALEVLDAPLLYELLCLWTASSVPNARHAIRVEGGWFAETNEVIAAQEIAERNVELLVAQRSDAEETAFWRRRPTERPRPAREASWDLADEDALAWEREQAERSTLRDRNVVQERLEVLDGTLREAGWIRLDIAALIVASEHDWIRSPIPGEVPKTFREKPAQLAKWIENTLASLNRRRKP